MRIRRWSGVLTLLSVLAVAVGAPMRPPMVGQRLSASTVAPALPEIRTEVRAAPHPRPSVGVLPPPPPPETFQIAREPRDSLAVHWSWQQPAPLSDLNVLGRRETDGG